MSHPDSTRPEAASRVSSQPPRNDGSALLQTAQEMRGRAEAVLNSYPGILDEDERQLARDVLGLLARLDSLSVERASVVAGLSADVTRQRERAEGLRVGYDKCREAQSETFAKLVGERNLRRAAEVRVKELEAELADLDKSHEAAWEHAKHWERRGAEMREELEALRSQVAACPICSQDVPGPSWRQKA